MNVPPLNVMFLVPVAVENNPAESVSPFKSNVPLVNVNLSVRTESVILLVTSCIPPLGASIVTDGVKDTPAELIVFVDLLVNISTPVPVLVTPEPKLKLPLK